jgi:hypothetical protein
MRYLTVDVYRPADGHDCTNDGVSATATELFVECPNGNIDEDETEPHLRFRVDDRGGGYLALRPTHPPEGSEKLCGPMYGGNLAASSDSRLRGPFHIHDRFETPSRY